MDTGNKTFNETGNRDPDADISLLMYKTGKSFKQFLLWIGRGFTKFGSALLVTLLYIFRNVIWLLIGLALGLAYGLYKQTQGSAYTSQMVVKANINSTRDLYNTIDYMNALIAAKQTNELSAIFGLSAAEAAQLSEFTIEPVESELITAEMYKEEFFQPEKNKRIRLDTFWTRTIRYQDFKESLTRYDYPFQKITAYTTNPTIFSKFGKGIIDHISKNQLLKNIIQKQAVSNAGEEELLVSSIKNLDTLRRAYNERLVKSQPPVPPGNQMTVVQGTPEVSTPELDLYDKMLQLQHDLKKSRERSVAEQNIIEVFSPFNPVGKKISLIKSLAWLAFYGFLIALAILLAVAFYRWLVAFEAKHKSKKKIPAV